jgi:hypothetical protein
MKYKIYIKIPSLPCAQNRRLKRALSQIEEILLTEKVPFEFIEDMGREYHLEDSCVGKRHSLNNSP